MATTPDPYVDLRRPDGSIDITMLPRWDSTVIPDAEAKLDREWEAAEAKKEAARQAELKKAPVKQQERSIFNADFFKSAEEKKVEQVETKAPAVRFTFDPRINRRVCVVQTDITKILADAIVNTSNERLTETIGVSGRVFAAAGRKMEEALSQTEGCPTGDAVLTPGFNLPATYCIHTVGPRYTLKYATAAENALHGCYRRALETAIDNKMHSIAFPQIATDRKQYPKKAASHVAIRTVRRFLEHHGQSIHTLAFVLDNEMDMTIWKQLMPLYFPRSDAEAARVQSQLPEETGNEVGEKVIEERKVKINTLPGVIQDAKQRPEAMKAEPAVTGEFIGMQDDPDTIRRRNDAKLTPEEKEVVDLDRKYMHYLRMARQEDLSDVSKYRFVYPSGVDAQGRPVIVFLGSHFPANVVPLERCLLHIINVMDRLVQSAYNVVYFHTNISDDNQPPLEWLKTCYTIFNRKYKKNLQRLFVVHSTMWVRTVVWFATPLVSKKFWSKFIYIHKLHDLYEQLDPRTLDVPKHIIKFDDQEFGAEYVLF
jgi:O-acetyl-ADP-ribose deacetylase (regulator of RNase III)